MTRISPRKDMNASEKRRGLPGSASPSRRALGSSHSSSNSASTPSSSSSTGTRAGASANVIAPPPRAALGSTSSPAPDDRRNRENPPPPPASNLATGTGGAATTSFGESNGSSNSSASVLASAAALQTLLRERDARILTLERELGLLEVEFRRELDKRSAAESDVTTFWQAKHGALHTQFLRTDTELRLLRAGDAQQTAREQRERDNVLAGWDSTRRELAAREDEVRVLRTQIRGLKEWVSTSTRADGETRTSDEVFGDGIARLGNGLQNWVIVNFRRAKIDLTKAGENVTEELGRLVPMYEGLAVSSKVHLLQTIVSRLLVDMVFEAYFVGLSEEQEHQFTQMETLLGSFGSPESVNHWRSQTLTILKKDPARKMQDETTRVTDTIISRVNEILDAMTDSPATPARDQGLRGLVTSAIELSRLLVVQKAVFKVLMPEILPHQRVTFDPATMEDVGGEDEDDLVERGICCVTFPGVIKRGDENGGHLQFRNVIAKARVLCSPE